MSEWTRAAADWARRTVSSGSTFEQVDIDGLTDRQLPAEAILLAVACARQARSVLDDARSSLEVAVSIPLPQPSDAQIPTSLPDLGDLLDGGWPRGPGHEVPGLYLLETSRWVREDEGEEYRRVLQDPRTPDGFDLAYSAWRSKEDGERGWPFNRCMWLRSRRS